MTYPLSLKQQNCLNFIRSEIETKGVAPALREIAKELGFKSPANAHWLVKAIEDAGYIKRVPGKHRSIELVPQGRVVQLEPDTHFLAARYARKHDKPIDEATNEILRNALGVSDAA
jgi:SOS-response transcriptional repressor LexA